MRKQFLGFGLLMILVGLMACGGGNDGSGQENLSDKAQLEKRIIKLENELRSVSGNDIKVDMNKASQLVIYYKGYADANPYEEASPEYLFKAAELNNALDKHKESIHLYERILTNYKEYDKRAECQFLIAFTYDTHLKEFGTARDMYQKVIDTYPNHAFARDAKASIENLGLSDEELIKKFEENLKKQEETAAE